MIALWSSLALAAPCPLDAPGLAALTAKATTVLDRDDLVSHGATWREIQEGLTCLEGPLPLETWASFLVGLALVERTLGDPGWAEPLQVATEIDPAVKRDLGDKTFRAFAPAPPPPLGDLLPTDAVYWLDGHLVDRLPPLTGGPHVVQRDVAGTWTTLVVRGDPFPPDWLPAPVVVPPPPAPVGITASGVVWGIAGAEAVSQEIDQSASDVDSRSATRALLGIGAHGRVGGRFGAGGDLVLGFTPGGSFAADGALGVALGPVLLGAGAATAVIEQADANQLAVLARPHLGLSGAVEIGSWTGSGGVGGGWLPACANASGWLAASPNTGGLSPVFGLDGGYSRLAFVEADGPNALVADRWWIGAAVGVGPAAR